MKKHFFGSQSIIYVTLLSLTLMLAFDGAMIGTVEGWTGYIRRDYVSLESLYFGWEDTGGSVEDYYDDRDDTSWYVSFRTDREDAPGDEAPGLVMMVAAYNEDTGEWEEDLERITKPPFSTGIHETINIPVEDKRYSEVQLRANVYGFGDIYAEGESGTGFRHTVHIKRATINRIVITFSWKHHSEPGPWPWVDDLWETWTGEIRLFGETYPWYGVVSTDETGRQKNVFYPAETVYITGSGYSPRTTCDLYVVKDTTWSDGMDIRAVVSVETRTIKTDALGQIRAGTVAWTAPLTPGKYDIIIDVNGNGIYDQGIDAIDDDDIKVTAGLFVIPELPLGTVTALLSMLAALTLFKKRSLIRIKP